MIQTATLSQNRDLANASPAMQQAAEKFEAVFLSQMLAPMFEDTNDGGMFGGGQAEATFKSLLIEQYGNKIASRHATGIAEAVMQEMIKIQEQNPC